MPQLSLHTPLGEITLSEDEGAIVALDWGRGSEQENTPLLREARDQLHDYFDGKRCSFQLPLAPHGTPYQRRVWSALCGIPAGETRSYADIAREVASTRIGELVMRELKKLDKVAYVRFASVYRSFEDVDEFKTLVDEFRR